MTPARKVLLICDETDTFVTNVVRRAVEQEERGEVSREGDPLALLEALTLTRPGLRACIAGLRVVAATGSVA